MYAYIACNKMQACSVEGKCFLVTFRAHDSSLPLSLSLPLPFLCSALSSQPYELLNLADALEKKQFSDGQCIIKQGDQASTFYIVEGGTTRILKEDPNNPGSQAELGTCTTGQYFGELALIANKPRAASVYAVGSVTCAGETNPLSISLTLFPISPSTVLDVGAFERLLGPCMDVMKRNFEHYEEQLMQLFGTTLDIADTR
jgi:cAMP-dependent protein kinase regulator